jgi:hypothetical protein
LIIAWTILGTIIKSLFPTACIAFCMAMVIFCGSKSTTLQSLFCTLKIFIIMYYN